MPLADLQEDGHRLHDQTPLSVDVTTNGRLFLVNIGIHWPAKTVFTVGLKEFLFYEIILARLVNHMISCWFIRPFGSKSNYFAALVALLHQARHCFFFDFLYLPIILHYYRWCNVFWKVSSEHPMISSEDSILMPYSSGECVIRVFGTCRFFLLQNSNY